MVQEGRPSRSRSSIMATMGWCANCRSSTAVGNYVDVALYTPDFVQLAKAYGIPAQAGDRGRGSKRRHRAST